MYFLHFSPGWFFLFSATEEDPATNNNVNPPAKWPLPLDKKGDKKLSFVLRLKNRASRPQLNFFIDSLKKERRRRRHGGLAARVESPKKTKSFRIAPDGHWQARPFTDRDVHYNDLQRSTVDCEGSFEHLLETRHRFQSIRVFFKEMF